MENHDTCMRTIVKSGAGGETTTFSFVSLSSRFHHYYLHSSTGKSKRVARSLPCVDQRATTLPYATDLSALHRSYAPRRSCAPIIASSQLCTLSPTSSYLRMSPFPTPPLPRTTPVCPSLTLQIYCGCGYLLPPHILFFISC
ncbi:hypothetical protein VNO80_06811 [Phaseolus coccineus]|uniref:Uncharacterized protein n=1 Tax=Phaseolus coccineus TaxID=3886 RepID=A0AAN9NMX4_PHACN